jgi:SAM-dependent methyltransferase
MSSPAPMQAATLGPTPSLAADPPGSASRDLGDAAATAGKERSDKIDFGKIRLDPSCYEEIFARCSANLKFNPGCLLHRHWLEMNRRDQAKIAINRTFGSFNWLGGGYPQKYGKRPSPDRRGIGARFANSNTLDVQSGLFQFYSIAEQLAAAGRDLWSMERIRVLEIGGGYGRLALFFLAVFGARCHYVSVDVVPTSLAYCHQVVRQCFPDLKTLSPLDASRVSRLSDYNFVSLPAWNIDLLEPIYDLGVNIHSFQEMEKTSFRFYIAQLASLLVDDALVYTINNPPPQTQYPGKDQTYYGFEDYFRGILRRPYALGRSMCGMPSLECAYVKTREAGSGPGAATRPASRGSSSQHAGPT